MKTLIALLTITYFIFAFAITEDELVQSEKAYKFKKELENEKH